MRGCRLNQADRIARKAFYDHRNQWWVEHLDGKDQQRAIGILRKTRKRCSCWMCGHRRRYEGPPIQKRRQGLAD